ncbi:unnamed protein product [Linum trigynum]|uniref:Uncharacterized protein n=1 Tax=Linum trigynum TaxID=586398 RepID=A0AAV2FEZ3_9ROSI
MNLPLPTHIRTISNHRSISSATTQPPPSKLFLPPSGFNADVDVDPSISKAQASSDLPFFNSFPSFPQIRGCGCGIDNDWANDENRSISAGTECS